jgi:hypothetical protein
VFCRRLLLRFLSARDAAPLTGEFVPLVQVTVPADFDDRSYLEAFEE